MTHGANWICVTGGNGYLCQHIIRNLLESGQNVRTTIRNLDQVQNLRTALCQGLGETAGRLRIVEADLTKDDGWDDAFRGCTRLIHTASPFPNRPPKDASALINLAVQGTQRVLRHAIEAGVTRAVVTSSIVAIIASDPIRDDGVHTEDDWSDPDHARADAYTRSKLEAEQAAWNIASDAGIELTALNPGLIFGPPLSGKGGTSVGIIERVLSGKDVALPDVSMPCVDVRDAARAHVCAVTSKEAVGQRILLNGTSMSFMDIAQVLRDAYPLNRITRKKAPDTMVRAAAKFDPFLANVLPYLGGSVETRSTKANDMLGVTFRDLRGAVLDTAEVLAGPAKSLVPA